MCECHTQTQTQTDTHTPPPPPPPTTTTTTKTVKILFVAFTMRLDFQLDTQTSRRTERRKYRSISNVCVSPQNSDFSGVCDYNFLLHLKSSKLLCILCDLIFFFFFFFTVTKITISTDTVHRGTSNKLVFSHFEGLWSEHLHCSCYCYFSFVEQWL